MFDQALLDYIRANAKQLFGNQFWEARFLYRVDLGSKPEKTERRVMVLSKFRIFFISGKTSSKLHVENSYPLLAVTAVTLPNNNTEASLTIDNRRLFIRFVEENLSSQDFVIQLLTAFKHYYQNCDLHRYIDLSPSSLHSMYSQLPLAKPTLPCGGFRRTYASLCDFYKFAFRDEIVWDIEKIYSLHHNTVLRLDDFSHLSSKDLIPLIATLQFSSWFDGIASETQKLPNEVIDVIMLVLKKSQRMKELKLKNCGLKK
uniref:CARMIL pleckstrin homology domain-containing protein n=1 Tax=Romanomermis culicivorax TaxID=13658 RepID=A0A915KMH5_ROMCU